MTSRIDPVDEKLPMRSTTTCIAVDAYTHSIPSVVVRTIDVFDVAEPTTAFTVGADGGVAIAEHGRTVA